MADELTENFQIVKPEIYGSDGTWGGKYHSAMDLIDDLLFKRMSVEIGDFYTTSRTLDATWLRRNGALYLSANYPDLAALLPVLPDGVNWTNVSSGITGTIVAITETAAGFLLAARSGADTLIYTSTDGESWGLVATISTFSAEGIVQGGGVFVLVDGNGKVSVSSDGATWSAPVTLGGGSLGLTSVAFGAGLFVICGTDGYIATSPDGASWTTRTSGTTQILQCVEFVNSTFLVGGGNGVLLTSTDGINWVSRTTGTTQAIRGATYGNSVYVVVGDDGTIRTSTTLATWTARASATTANLYVVQYSSTGFIAAGQNGVVRISPADDGLTWTAAASGVSITFRAIAFDTEAPQRYLLGGSSTLLLGIRTLSTQFQVPNDSPTYGWIKALSELPEE